ncbi:hypothetical protein CSKR_202530 [Clonorchis sinensis]|uniref:Uncharacterized protein n=1 Tax=Clonorchis sinensis TaxID=79923 RepID=A0A8T1MX64_CLOSI|nr:hypothetical protein CSKR_202530 [Clonorchis sinensis]
MSEKIEDKWKGTEREREREEKREIMNHVQTTGDSCTNKSGDKGRMIKHNYGRQKNVIATDNPENEHGEKGAFGQSKAVVLFVCVSNWFIRWWWWSWNKRGREEIGISLRTEPNREQTEVGRQSRESEHNNITNTDWKPVVRAECKNTGYIEKRILCNPLCFDHRVLRARTHTQTSAPTVLITLRKPDTRVIEFVRKP